MIGFITLHRKMLEWEWYKDTNTKTLFIHLLLKANHKDQKFQGKEVKRGQLITGRKALSYDLNISEQSIRTSLNRLKSTNEITIKTTKQNSLITINNYDFYQNEKTANQQTNQQLTNSQPTANQQLTTNNNVNNVNNENSYIAAFENFEKVTTEIALHEFDKSGLKGRWFSTMAETYSIDQKALMEEFQKWKIKNAETVFKDVKHMKNSFSTWLRGYRPSKKENSNSIDENFVLKKRKNRNPV